MSFERGGREGRKEEGGKEAPAATASHVLSALPPPYRKNNAYWDTALNAQRGCRCWLQNLVPCHCPPSALAIRVLLQCKAAFHGETADSSLLLLDIICLWIFFNSCCILLEPPTSWMKLPSAPGFPLIHFTCLSCSYSSSMPGTGRHTRSGRCLGP